MEDKSDATRVRQGELGQRTFLVLIVSITIAALIAIAAYLYVFAEDDAELQGQIPSTGTIEASPDATQ